MRHAGHLGGPSGGRFRGIVGAIDGCPSLEELGALGKRLYALGLSNDQVGVAWSHYRLRKEALEAAVPLRQAARTLLGEVERAHRRFLHRLGACPYRVQRAAYPDDPGVAARVEADLGGVPGAARVRRRSPLAAPALRGRAAALAEPEAIARGGVCAMQGEAHGLAPVTREPALPGVRGRSGLRPGCPVAAPAHGARGVAPVIPERVYSAMA